MAYSDVPVGVRGSGLSLVLIFHRFAKRAGASLVHCSSLLKSEKRRECMCNVVFCRYQNGTYHRGEMCIGAKLQKAIS